MDDDLPAAVNTPLVPVSASGVIIMPDKNDASPVLHDFRTTLFELVEKPRDQDDKSSSVNPFRGIMNPLYKRRMSYDELVAKYVSLWPVLEAPESHRYVLQALLGLKYLSNGQLGTSQAIFEEIEFNTSTPAALSYVMRGITMFLRSMALVIFVFAYFIAAPFFSELFSISRSADILGKDARWFSFDMLDGTLRNVLVAAVAGMLGSVVSLLLRLSEFEGTKGRSQRFRTLTGATLPIVGGVFGAFAAVLLSAKVVNISIGAADGTNVWLYIVIGFLSGFSERFSRGFIAAAEQQFGGSSGRNAKTRASKPKR